MFSARQHLAFATRPAHLITRRLEDSSGSQGAVPCRKRTAFERRFKCRKRTFLTVADFTEMISGFRDETVVADILSFYEKAENVPQVLTKRQVVELMAYKKSAWERQLKYLCSCETRRNANRYQTYRLHRHFRQKIPFLGQIFDESGKLVYGTYNNSIFSAYDIIRTMDPLTKLTHAAVFGQKLVFDFSYDHLMRSREQCNVASQLLLSHVINRKRREPFDFWFASYQSNAWFEQEFKSRTGGVSPSDMMISVRSEPLEQLFPIENVVYLSPHADDVLTEFDNDAIYVIGAFVDTYRNDSNENSFKRANSVHIRSLRLPVLVEARKNRAPCLTMSSVAAMLIDMRNDGISVKQAVDRHLSIRKMRPPLALQKKKLFVQEHANVEFPLEIRQMVQ